jgi:olefin beta-lactone synthetase
VFVLVCLSLGVTAVLPDWKLSRHDQVTADAISAQIRRHKVTRLLVPPVICETLANGSLPRLDAIFTGGGPVFPDTIQKLKSLQKSLRVVAVYGSTEAEPIAHLEANNISDGDIKAMSDGQGLLAGKPVEAVKLQIVDGEVQVAGPHVNEGYLDASQNAENKVLRDGMIWHRTGDAARLDEQGRLWLLGRYGNRVGGIDPFSVETAARFWPGLKRSALVSIDGKPVLAVEGDANHLALWTENAAQLGITDLRYVSAIPMDKRHRSKVDIQRLKQMI